MNFPRTILCTFAIALGLSKANAATYFLLSQTNAFAAGITNAAKAYTDAHSGAGIAGTVITNGVAASAGNIAAFTTTTNIGAATSANIQGALGQVYAPTNYQASYPVWFQTVKLVTAVLDNSQNNWQLRFTPASNQTAIVQFMVPGNYGSSPVLNFMIAASAATNGAFVYSAEVMAISGGASADVNTDSYDTANLLTNTVAATAGFPQLISIPLTNNDSWKTNDLAKIRLSVLSTGTTTNGLCELLSGNITFNTR